MRRLVRKPTNARPIQPATAKPTGGNPQSPPVATGGKREGDDPRLPGWFPWVATHGLCHPWALPPVGFTVIRVSRRSTASVVIGVLPDVGTLLGVAEHVAVDV